MRTPPVVGPLSGDTSSTSVSSTVGSASPSTGEVSRGRLRPSRTDNARCCPRRSDTLDWEASAAAEVPEEVESVVAVMPARGRFGEVELA